MIDIEQKLQVLSNQKNQWRTLSSAHKIRYIDQVMNNLTQVKDHWVELCAKHKQISSMSQTIAQEWLSGPVVVMRMLRLLKLSLLSDASPSIKKISKNKFNQYCAQVLPTNFYESALFYPMRAEIILQKDKPFTQGTYYRALQNTSGYLCVILGAGNVSSMPALDAINQLFAHGQVCILKFNPINDYLFEIFESVFKPLIDDGFLALTKGGKDVGEYLCSHQLTDAIHLTGSVQTYQSILKFNKKVTAELGCVTPVIVTPGQWTQRDLRFYARHIASAVENNASFNCNAMKVLLIDAHWSQKEEFLNILRDEFSHIPLRNAYYPGAHERYLEFLKLYPQAEILGDGVSKDNLSEQHLMNMQSQKLPWALIPNIKIQKGEYALNHEAFCGVLAVAEVQKSGGDPSKFLNEVVKICNQYIFGTLSCTLIVDSNTHKNFTDDVENTISNLQYGSIGVNCWAAVSYVLCATTWGAFPNTETQSGVGVINNGYFFDYPEKSVVRAPFRQLTKPVWFYDKKNAVKIAKNLFDFEYSQSFFDFLKLGVSALELF